MAIALRYAARSNLGLGPKARNEDSGYAGPHLLVLADGMGGHAAGDVASSMIVGTLAHLDGESVGADQAIRLLEKGLREANEAMASAMEDDAELGGMGSTTIAILRTGNKLAMAHIGDSRAFLLRGGVFSQITKDHSFVQQLVDEGRISPEDAAGHPQRSVVTRVMTGSADDEPDTSLREAKVGDRLMLCSDGLSDFVTAEVIEEILTEAKTPEQAADRLIEVALKASTRDNVTVIVADVVDGGGDLPETVPQIVGAASKRLSKNAPTQAIPVSPAEKAAALSRQATGRGRAEKDAADAADAAAEVELAEAAKRSRSSKIMRRSIGAVLVAGLLGAGGYAAYAWSQNQYFVGAQDGKVAIFRGVDASLGPIRLFSLESNSNIPLTDLPVDVQGNVTGAIPARDLTDARAKIGVLSAEAARCRALAQAGTVCGSIPVTPATTVPTVAPTGSTTVPSGIPTFPTAKTPAEAITNILKVPALVLAARPTVTLPTPTITVPTIPKTLSTPPPRTVSTAR